MSDQEYYDQLEIIINICKDKSRTVIHNTEFLEIWRKCLKDLRRLEKKNDKFPLNAEGKVD